MVGALLAPEVFAQSLSTKPVLLRNETISTLPRPFHFQAAALGPLLPAASGLFLIQFEDRMQPEWPARLRALGVELVQYVPQDAFVAHLDQAQLEEVEALEFVRWVGPYRPDHKVHGPLRRLAEQQPGGPLSVTVLLAPQAGPEAGAQVRSQFRAVTTDARTRFGSVLRGQLAPGRLQALAGSPAVLWVEAGPNIRMFDEIASKIVAGDGGPGRTSATQLGYDGRGVTVAVADSGLDSGNIAAMHPDLAGRVRALFYYGALTDASDEHGHGTHCAGIVAGNATLGETDEAGTLYGLGVAPGAGIIAQRIFDAEGGFEAPATFEILTRDAVRAGADIGSNSWGDDTQGRYDVSAMEFDALVRDADDLTVGDQPYILEFSAGNAGPGAQTVGSPAVAKNVIATGASENDRLDFFLYADGIDVMADFSSRGPCEDGRIKPDVVAPGTWIASLRSVFANDDFSWAPISQNYLYEGGTSQAGPHISGAAAVFVQYYRQQNTNETPSPAMVKAALINSATDMDDSFGTDPVPNMDEGWGRVDLASIVESSAQGRFVDQKHLLQTGQSYERRVIIASATESLKVTLAYTDVPGFPAAIPALVNDLDLEVVGPDGRIYRGNQFQHGESLPNPSARDSINNVEGVHLATPDPGEYLIRVVARNVVQDARRETPAIDQDFALAISGDIPLPGLGFVFLDRRAYTVPSTVRVKVIDSDQATKPSVTVTVRSTTQSQGLSLILLPNGNGSFTGSVATATSPGAGRLQILHGDSIEVAYQDVSAGVVRSATARADLLPPAITAVTTGSQFGRTTVNWLTDEPATSVVRYGNNNVLTLAVTNAALTRAHGIPLEDLTPGVTYQFLVISEDEAGNRATNNNGGGFFEVVAQGAPTILLVDAFVADDFGFGPDIPRTSYTQPLDAIGVTYDVWDLAGGVASPTLADLRPYRAVIWRISDNVFLGDTLSAPEQAAVQQYVAGGGSFLMASMEQLTRLPAAFRQNVLQVAASVADATVPSAVGLVGNLITAGMNIPLDYSDYATESYDLFQVPSDVSDTLTPSTNAIPILQDGSGLTVGLAWPQSGSPAIGRVIFLSFPLEAVPMTGPDPNNRVALLRNLLGFLAPGRQGVGSIVLDSTEYTLPSRVGIEVADSDLAGQGQIAVSVSSRTEPVPRPVLLSETAQHGIFRGSISLVSQHGANPAAELRALAGDPVVASYLDVSLSRTLSVTSRVDVLPPVLSGLQHEPSYVDAVIRWQTSEPADALVQFGESPLLGRTAYVPTLGRSHEVVLEGLRPDRVYYYQVASHDLAGNVAELNNNGSLYTFRTLRPLLPPWFDDLEHGNQNWTVQDAEESEVGWGYGTPRNGLATAGHSGSFAWGSNLQGLPVGFVETFLISPPIDLTGGNRGLLRFWQNYDFTGGEGDILHYGEVMLITNATAEPISLGAVEVASSGWEPAEYDLTSYTGNLVYVVWHYVLFSFDNNPRPGWLIDDISVTVSNVVPGVIRITNTVSQARWVLTGPANRSGQGLNTVLSNMPPGLYHMAFGDVPFLATPPGRDGTLASSASLLFLGNYGVTDVNNNGMPDAWEQQFFGSVSSTRTRLTDTDGDGMPDVAEYEAGTNPTQAGSLLRLARPVILARTTLRLQWSSVQGHAYLVEGSRDGHTWLPLSSWLLANTITTTFELPTGPTAPFLFRLQVRP